MSNVDISSSYAEESLPNGNLPHASMSYDEEEEHAGSSVAQSATHSPITPKSTLDALLDTEEFKNELRHIVDSQIKAGVKPANALEQLTTLLHCSRTTTPLKSMEVNSPYGTMNGHTAVTPTPLPANNGKVNLPTIPINDIRNEGHLNADERTLRCKLAALFRLIDVHGWTHGLYNHISARLNIKDNAFLVNPFGLLYHEVSASNLVKVNNEGKLSGGENSNYGINKSSWLLHSALFLARADVNCIVHLHLPDVVAISCMKCGLLSASLEANQLLKDAPNDGLVRYHAYPGVLTHLAKDTPDPTHDLGPHAKVLFLRNHGALVCAASVEEAWYLCRLLVSACQAQARLVHLGGLASLEANAVTPLRGLQGKHVSTLGANADHHVVEFEAMMRLLDNAGYRTGYNYCQPHLVHRVVGSISDAAADVLGADDVVVTHAHYDYDEQRANSNAQRIKEQVAANRQKATQRSQWLVQEERVTPTRSHEPIVEEPNEHAVNHSLSHTLPSPKRKDQAKVEHDLQHQVKVTTVTRSVTSNDKSDPSKNSTVTRSATMGIKTGDGTDYGATSATSDADSRFNTLKSDPGQPEEQRPRQKKGLKIAGFRIPSFSKKKK